MKNSRIIALILAIVMTVSCFATLGMISAEENTAAKTAPTPVIMSYNVAFGSYFYLEAAISTASVGGEGKTVAVSLYDSADATDALATAEATYTTEGIPASFGGSAYTVQIPYAISFADTAKEFYIEAKCDGAKSARAKYSIVEYCLQRLYKDGVSGEQKELCQNILNFAASIDKLDAEKTATALDYRYVAVKADGNVGGYRAAIVVNGNTAKVTVNAGAAVSSWKVTSYAADGTTSTSEMSAAEAAEGFAVTENMILEPKVEAAPGTYFDAYGGYTYDNEETALAMNNKGYLFSTKNAVNDTQYTAGKGYVKFDSQYSSGANAYINYLNLTANPKDAADKVLRMHKYGSKDYPITFLANQNDNYKTGNVFVFETDLYMPAVPEHSYAGTTDPSIFKFYLGTSNEITDQSTEAKKSWNVSALSSVIAYISAFTNEDSTLSYYLTAKQNDKGTAGIELKPETWYTITMEVYENVKDSSYVYLYVNGTRVYARSLGTLYDIDSFDSIGVYTRGLVAKDGFGLYFDDTFVGVINK